MITKKSAREINNMREVGRLAAKTLKEAGKMLKAGISTEQINEFVHKMTLDQGAIPAPLNYRGFPKSVCTSLNDVICHGIPSKEDVLKNGDIINVDVTTIWKGLHGDTSKTYLIGDVDPNTKKLVDVAHKAMIIGIQEVRPGARTGNIGAAIEEYVHDHKFSIVEDYCGHGIGRKFHEDPQILHYGKKNTGVEMFPGMVFTIEPMINVGEKYCELLDDDWTVVTADGSLSAQFEHTILVTEDGFEVFTIEEGDEL